MIDKIAELPDELLRRSGSVFYSGRAAFSGQAPIYLLGTNPGGDREKQAAETVAAHIKAVLSDKPEVWSEYCDESWGGQRVGGAKLQQQVRYLLSGLGLDPRRVPASNLVFVRSRQADGLGAELPRLIEQCWPVHKAALEMLRPKAVICFGIGTGERVRKLLGACRDVIASSTERHPLRRWRHRAWRTPTGLIVFGIAHPSRADWTNSLADPIPMIRALLPGLQVWRIRTGTRPAR
jgi:hypothetical protein